MGLKYLKLEVSPVPEISFLPTPYRGWTRAPRPGSAPIWAMGSKELWEEKKMSGTGLAGGLIKYLNNAHVFSFCPCPTLFECLVPTLLSWSYEHWLTLNVVVWFYFLHWKNPCRLSQGALILHNIGNTRITWIRLRSSLSVNQVPICSILSAASVFMGICNSS